MSTTATDFIELLDRVNTATAALQKTPTVPRSVAELVDDFEPSLHADAPLQLEIDPYLGQMLFAAAFRAEKALRHDNVEAQHRDLQIALEQFRHALRDIVANQPFGSDAPVRDVLANTLAAVSLPQREFADLLGVSTRQLQRWLALDGPTPNGRDEARVRIVAQLVNQLRHAFTAPGVVAWFTHLSPVLGVEPITQLDEPLRYPELLSAAASSRAMTG